MFINYFINLNCLTVLFKASGYNQTELLLENGANINGYTGWIPLQQGILFILLFKLIASRSG
jgi:hypothetical protein